MQVRGPPDSIPALADSLTRRLIGILLEESPGRLPSVDLASLTTRSVPALKAFLRGERHFRKADFEPAISEYRRAVQRDSAFALAHWRLARAYGWQREEGTGNPERKHRTRAYELSNRLPERERRLARADYLLRDRRPAAATDSLDKLRRIYPEDPEVWYLLGEAALHFHQPPGWPQADRYFGRAVTLDPGFAPYHTHRIDLAFNVHRDSTVVAARIEAHPSLDGSEPWLRLLTDLVFGDAARRATTLAGLDTVATSVLNRVAGLPLLHPEHGALHEALEREAVERQDNPSPKMSSDALVLLAFHHLGQPRQALSYLEQPELDRVQRACLAAYAQSVGIPVPDSARPTALNPALLDRDAGPELAACIGLYAVARGKERTANRALAHLRRQARSMRDTVRQRRPLVPESALPPERLVALVAGYRAWQQRRPQKATRLLSQAGLWHLRRPTGIWMGDIQRELGDREAAEGWYLGSWHLPLSHQRLGRLYAEMGETEKAAAAYRRFIEAWEDAEEPLQPRVEDARRRLTALTGEKSGRE